MNYKKIALMICLVSSVMVGRDNNEEWIKDLEKAQFKTESEASCLNKEVKNLSADQDVAESVDDQEESVFFPGGYNYQITKCIWMMTCSVIFGIWEARESCLGKNFYVTASNVVIAGVIILPIDYLVRNYVLKKDQVKKRRQVVISS